MIRPGARYDLSFASPAMFDCEVIGTSTTDPILGAGEVMLRARALLPGAKPQRCYVCRETLLDPERWPVRRIST